MTVTHDTTEIVVAADSLELPGMLSMPTAATGLVVFVHGSGSSRLSPRNRAVAEHLVRRGCGTLLFDLLTDVEAANRGNVFDIALLSARVQAATRSLRQRADVGDLPLGYFGASTGAAAALVAAADDPASVVAVVSRGGRPDLAGRALPNVTAPTLLIVGSLDAAVLDLNREAQEQMTCPTELLVIDGATHLFEEPGTLEEAAGAAANWFTRMFAAHGESAANT